MKIYNSMTKQKEPFQPLSGKTVKLYVCGMTVYDLCHIGHARSFISFDNVVRFLRFQGYEVTYVRNITDIDDKIIKRAQESGQTFDEVVDVNIQAMNEDFDRLGMLTPDQEPRATAYIPEIIALVQTLLDKEIAYVVPSGDVLYSVKAFPHYGCLSHRDLEGQEVGVRVDADDEKRDPQDFVLWKQAKPGEPSWDSPWGKGRPGWHIECSAMSMKCLGEQLDLHGGGMDLMFVHHENEIAQSEAATGKTFVKTWMHTGSLQVDNVKMSKSLGNFFTIRDVLAKYAPEAIRFFVAGSHYRSPLNFSNQSLDQARHALRSLYIAVRGLPDAQPKKGTSFEAAFVDAMEDDFNTPVALSALFDCVHEINKSREEGFIDKAAELAALLKKLSGVLGFMQLDPEVFLQSAEAGQTFSEQQVEKIEKLIMDRKQARADKDYAKADQIRIQLDNMDVVIEDGAQGTTWRHK